jgi:tetratricopeptide (TPR) repeat protein
MPTGSFSWLHLTDLHYGLKGQGHLWPTLREPFLESLGPLHDRCGPWDAVLFTGDLVQSGESAQFERMQAEFLDPLWKRLDELGSGDAVLLAVPGNHDLYRPNPQEDNAAIDALLEKDSFSRIQEKFWDRPAGPYRGVVRDAFAPYSQWWEKAPHRPDGVKAGILPGDFSVSLGRVGIVGLNTTFLQLAGGDSKGRLVWNARQIDAVCEGGVDIWSKQHDICLLLTHQGPDWLTPEARKEGESEIAPAGRFAVHLFGHMHETEITYIRRGGSPKATRLSQGCSVFGMEKFGEPPTTLRAHGYAAGRIELGDGNAVLRLWPRIATDKTGPWRFTPDHEHAELEGDEGTPPEPVGARSRTTSAPPANSTITPAPVPTVPHSTLPARRPFFGRTKDLELIAKYLLPKDRSWGVVIDGPGGVGKTALALEAAHRAPAEHFPLKLWITAKNKELLPEGEYRRNDHHVGDFHAMLNEIGWALDREDIRKAVLEERPNIVRHALANRRALLVLDNLETFGAEDRRRAFELLDNLPATCRAVITSRRRPGGSTAGHYLRLDKIEREAADELLAELGKRWAPVARVTEAKRDQLYRETGGNPLLLTWTAGQLGRTTSRCRTVAEAVERLQEAHRLQKLDERNDPLEFVFGDLVETFTADEKAVLAALVHFSRPVPIEWLLPLARVSSKAAETALDGLRDRALLVEDEQATAWLLPPLAARFLRRACPEEVGASGECLADQAYALVVENGHKEFARFHILEEAWPQIEAALPLLAAGDNGRLQATCSSLKFFFDFSGHWDDWLLLSSQAEVKAEFAGDFFNAGWRAHDAAHCHFLLGRSEEVLTCADRAAAHWQATRTGTRERAIVWRLRGHGHLAARNFPAAISAYREAVKLDSTLRPRSEDLSMSLNDLAEALYKSGQIDEAETHFREALVIAKDLRDLEGIATYIGNLAEVALDRKRWLGAERLAREALKEAEDVHRKELIALDCWRLARALAQQRRGAEGRDHAKRAMEIFMELHSPKLEEAQATLTECLA